MTHGHKKNIRRTMYINLLLNYYTISIIGNVIVLKTI
jgi:hypothetical protein